MDINFNLLILFIRNRNEPQTITLYFPPQSNNQQEFSSHETRMHQQSLGKDWHQSIVKDIKSSQCRMQASITQSITLTELPMSWH